MTAGAAAPRLRAARPADAPAIAALLEAAFAGPAEARLAAALRAAGDAPVEWVAEAADGTLAGHVLFSPLRVGAQPALALAPLAVAAAARRRGLGAALVRAGLAAAARTGAGWCLVLGDPAYYGRLGFDAAAAAGITGVPWAGHPAFQARPLVPGVAPLRGVARYACAFGLPSPEPQPSGPPAA